MMDLSERLATVRHDLATHRSSPSAGRRGRVEELVADVNRLAERLWRLDADRYVAHGGGAWVPAADGFDEALRDWLAVGRAVATYASEMGGESGDVGGLDVLRDHVEDAEGVLLCNAEFIDAGVARMDGAPV